MVLFSFPWLARTDQVSAAFVIMLEPTVTRIILKLLTNEIKYSSPLYFQNKYQDNAIDYANTKNEIASDIITLAGQRFRIPTAFITFSQDLQ